MDGRRVPTRGDPMRATIFCLATIGAAFVASEAHGQYYNPYAAYYQMQMQQQMLMQQAYAGYGSGGYGYAQPYLPSIQTPVTSMGSAYTGGAMPANPYLSGMGGSYGMSPY